MDVVCKMKSNAAFVLAQSDRQVRAALIAMGTQAEGHAKDELLNVPERVDTGLLRNSITYAISGEEPRIKSYRGDNPSRYRPKAPIPEGSYAGQAPSAPSHRTAVWIGTNVEYAIYVHDGTVNMTANRFIKNAITKNRKEYKEIAKAYLKGSAS